MSRIPFTMHLNRDPLIVDTTLLSEIKIVAQANGGYCSALVSPSLFDRSLEFIIALQKGAYCPAFKCGEGILVAKIIEGSCHALIVDDEKNRIERTLMSEPGDRHPFRIAADDTQFIAFIPETDWLIVILTCGENNSDALEVHDWISSAMQIAPDGSFLGLLELRKNSSLN